MAIFNSVGKTPCSKDRFAIFDSGYAIDSEIHFRCLGRIPSLPGAPSLSLLMTALISFVLVGSTKNAVWRLSVRKFLWDMSSVIIFEARVGPTLTKKLLNPFEITFGSIVTWSFSMNCFEFLVILFLLMTSLTIVQTFRRLFLFCTIWLW